MTAPVVVRRLRRPPGRRRLSGRDAADRRAGRAADHRSRQGRLGGVAGRGKARSAMTRTFHGCLRRGASAPRTVEARAGAGPTFPYGEGS